MARAAAALCALKLRMDRDARDPFGQFYLHDWMDSRNTYAYWTCVYWGDALLRLVVPFLDWESSAGECFQAMVDPRFVLGASIKGLPEHVAEEQVADKIARYAMPGPSWDQVLYIWYKPLGLFSAHEGKHRVAFMRAHNQPAIAAWVREAGYPVAERLTLIEPDDIQRDEWLAMLDGRYLQVLRRPRVSRFVLETYGVKTRRWRDLPDLPDEQRVRQEIYERRLHRSPRTIAEKDRTLDLEDVRKREQDEALPVVRTIHDLFPWRFAWCRYLSVAVACLLLALVLCLSKSMLLHTVGLVLFGVATGLACGLNLIRFVGPREAKLRAHNNDFFSNR